MLPAGLLSGPDQDIPSILGSLALWSCASSHFATSAPVPGTGSLCSSLIDFPFAVLWAARGITDGREKTKPLFSVPAFTCLLGFRVKHISTAAAQHKGAREVEILTAVKCSWQSMCSQLEQIWLNFLKDETRDIFDAKATAATKFDFLFLSRGVQEHLKKKNRPVLTWFIF